MDLRLYEEVEETLDISDVEIETSSFNAPSKRFVRNAKAMAATPADVKEYTNKYVFVLDMPGVKPADIRVHVAENRVLYVNAKRKRSEDDESGNEELEKKKEELVDQALKYLSMERRMGKFMKRFALPDDADTEAVSAVYKDGVLTITIEKKPPPEPKKSKFIEVKVA